MRSALIDSTKLEAVAVVELGDRAVKASSALTESITPELRKLCAVRAAHYRHQLDRGLLSAIVALLAKAYVFAAYHRSSREASARALAEREKSRENAELAKALEDLGRAHHELQASKEQLVRSETMASLGGMVAGIAHEINTPVGTSLTALSHLDEQVERLEGTFKAGTMKKSALAEFFEDCALVRRSLNTNLARTAELVRSFKLVAADQTSDAPRLIDVNEYLRDVIVSLGPELKKAGHAIAIESPGAVHVRTYPGALSQIVTNLTMNAILHAYEAGTAGKLRVVVSREESDPVRPIALTYTDDGRGIPAEHIGRLFEPFFTTKRGSGGTGLGLNLVHNLVTQKLNGAIDCASTPGSGTTFTIRLPLELAE
jgi:two-component system NtrC family sensor kinase